MHGLLAQKSCYSTTFLGILFDIFVALMQYGYKTGVFITADRELCAQDWMGD